MQTITSPTSDIPGSPCLQSAEQITKSDVRSQDAKIHAPMPKKSHISKLLGWGSYIASQTRFSSTDLHSADIKVSSDPPAPRDNRHSPTKPIPIVRSATAPPNSTAEDDEQIHASARTSSDSIVGRSSGLLSSTREFSDAENERSSVATLEGTYFSLNSPTATSSKGSMAESPSRASVSTIRATQNNVAELDVFSPGYPTTIWPNASSNNASLSSPEPLVSLFSFPDTPANGIPKLAPKHSMPDSPSLARSSSSSIIHSARQQTTTLASAGPERKTKFGYSPIKPKKRDLTATLTQTVQDLETKCEEYTLEVSRLKSELETSEKQRKNATEISRFLMSEWGPNPSEQEQVRVDIADGASPEIEATMHNLQGQVAHLTNALRLVTKVVFGEEFDILPDQSISPAFPEDRDIGGVTTRWDQLFSLIRRKSTTRSVPISPATGSAGPNSQDGNIQGQV
jgi:hypothetical protein